MDDNSLVAAFTDELAAHRYLERLLWPEDSVCPCCGALGRVHKLDGASTRVGALKCYACRRIFSISYGTLFQGSHVPLNKWLQAIYLTDGGRARIRPFHLSKIIGVSHKTATAMALRIEKASERGRQLLPAEPIQSGSAAGKDLDILAEAQSFEPVAEWDHQPVPGSP